MRISCIALQTAAAATNDRWLYHCQSYKKARSWKEKAMERTAFFRFFQIDLTAIIGSFFPELEDLIAHCQFTGFSIVFIFLVKSLQHSRVSFFFVKSQHSVLNFSYLTSLIFLTWKILNNLWVNCSLWRQSVWKCI